MKVSKWLATKPRRKARLVYYTGGCLWNADNSRVSGAADAYDAYLDGAVVLFQRRISTGPGSQFEYIAEAT